MPFVRLVVGVTALLSALLCLSAGSSRAEEVPAMASPDAVAWTVQVDPLTTALGIVHILFERRVADHVAVYVGPSLRLYDSLIPITPDDEEGYRAYGIETGARWFFSGQAPTGWWAGVRVTMARMTFGDEARMGGYVSALGGYAWVINRRWVLSGALGVSYFDYAVGGRGIEGFLPAAHTGIGVAF